jgi:hypothetical protein
VVAVFQMDGEKNALCRHQLAGLFELIKRRTEEAGSSFT